MTSVTVRLAARRWFVSSSRVVRVVGGLKDFGHD